MKKVLFVASAVALFGAACMTSPAVGQAKISAKIDVWPGTMPAIAPKAERDKQVEVSVETKDRHGSPDTVFFNVTRPTLEVVRPTVASNGAAIVVVPGGGFRVLSYANEGVRVAEWAAAHGFTAFILKYRLNPMPNDPKVLQGLVSGGGPRPGAPGGPPAPAGAAPPPGGEGRALPPMTIGAFEQDAISDGVQALKTVRARASEYGIDPARVGIIGFSAGGVVSGSTAIAANPAERPNFVGIVYSRVTGDVPKGAPPAFFAAAADDGLADSMPADFGRWLKAGSQAEIHIYSKGQHGFGTVKQNLPVDGWLDAFYAWMVQQGFTRSAS